MEVGVPLHSSVDEFLYCHLMVFALFIFCVDCLRSSVALFLMVHELDLTYVNTIVYYINAKVINNLCKSFIF